MGRPAHLGSDPDAIRQAVGEDPGRRWLRLIVAAVASSFLFQYTNLLTGIGWLAGLALVEAVGAVFGRQVKAGVRSYQGLFVANTALLSLLWAAQAVILWRVGAEVPRIAALMDIFTVALYAAVGAQRSLAVMFALMTPVLGAGCFLLISALWREAPPAMAAMGSFATIGAFATVAANGVAMHLTQRGLLRANADLEKATQAKSTFLATMSHEIRTPLNGVLGMADAMARDDLPRSQAERLEVIRLSGRQLLSILNDVLDLSKIEAGKLLLEEDAFDLAESCIAVVASFSGLAASKSLPLELSFAAGAQGRYLGDATRVRQILTNLISNALKFTERGRIDVVVERTADGIEILVRDTGIGLAREHIERLFEKFEQQDSSTTRRFGGTGLGLTICRELAERMGGAISATGEVGAGSTFTVTLPLQQVGDATPPAQTAAGPTGPDPQLRVLVAEDNDINRRVISTLLEQAGLSPRLVNDGAQAIEAWRAETFDLILMDVQMPILDGPSASRQIRQLEIELGRPRTPIIALTANAMAHQVSEYRAAGMDAHVAKPIEVARLFEAIVGCMSADVASSEARVA